MSDDELLDLLNENDEIIGTVLRSEANSNKCYIHREIAILLFDKDMNLLLQKRAMTKKVFPGLWVESVAGHILSSETADNTAHKELQEELGFDTELKFLFKFLHDLEHETHFTYWYAGKYNNEQITLDKEEASEFKVVSKNEIYNMFDELTPDLQAVVDKIWTDETITKISAI
jgi:isopentenyl-diphosphate Delta-isomerase